MTNDNSNNAPLTASEADAGERLDRFLSTKLEGFSRTRLKDLIKRGHVCSRGVTIVEPNHRIKPGDSFEVNLPPPEDPIPKAEPIPLSIAYEDDALIVVDKPAGMVVHPAAGNWTGTLVNALIAHCGDSLSGIGGVKRPGIVHRLDKDTSGLIVIAKTDAAHKGLTKQFADKGLDGRLERRYRALVWSAPPRMKGTVETLLARKQTDRQRMAVVKKAGRHAVTHYATVARYVLPGETEPVASLVECILETGRTHQIRVHMAHLGCPVIGDALYGPGFATKAKTLTGHLLFVINKVKRQALHAAVLGFEHPVTGVKQRFASPLPEEIENAVNALENL